MKKIKIKGNSYRKVWVEMIQKQSLGYKALKPIKKTLFGNYTVTLVMY